MPKKSKRIASRQAQLSGRGRRVRRHGPMGLPTEATEPSVSPLTPEDGVATTAPPVEAPSAPASESRWSAGPQETTPTPGRSPQRRRRTATPISPAPYFRREIRRIGVVTGLILVALVVLTIVLQ